MQGISRRMHAWFMLWEKLFSNYLRNWRKCVDRLCNPQKSYSRTLTTISDIVSKQAARIHLRNTCAVLCLSDDWSRVYRKRSSEKVNRPRDSHLCSQTINCSNWSRSWVNKRVIQKLVQCQLCELCHVLEICNSMSTCLKRLKKYRLVLLNSIRLIRTGKM